MKCSFIHILNCMYMNYCRFTIADMEDTLNDNLLREARRAEEDADGKRPLKDRIWIESKKMWIVAGPAIFTRFSTLGVSVISLAFIGHIGSTELAAYSLVSTVLLRFAIGILVSLLHLTSLISSLWFFP